MEIDRRENELYGQERRDEPAEHRRTREGRRQALREAKQRLEGRTALEHGHGSHS